MTGAHDLEALLDHLVQTTRLSRGEASRVVADVLSFHAESAHEFVVRRHRELRARRVPNAVIFDQISGELRERRFSAPPLSARQIRRLIYG